MLGYMIALSLAAVTLCSAHGGAHSGHGKPDGDVDNRFHDTAVVQDAEHVKEHLQEQINVDVANMTDEELEFHYFKLHDTDNNTKLDGLEILQALSHNMVDDDIAPPLTEAQLTGKSPEQVKHMERERRNKVMDYFTEFIDRILTEDDLNNDGYLTYVEYVLARRRSDKKHDDERQKSNKDEI